MITHPALDHSNPAEISHLVASGRLLAWYDIHRRVLPWRANAGDGIDPYRVWLSEIMLQQTTVKTVGPYFEKFVTRWPTVADLAASPLDDVLSMWAGLGYYSRARNLHACAVSVMKDHGGSFPDTEVGLRKLPGIGPYTAAAIAAIAFGRPVMPVDGNIERITTRVFAVDGVLPQAKPLVTELAQTFLDTERAGDSAQAMMDVGSSICRPRNPDCGACPFAEDCKARAEGSQETYPRKLKKKSGELRRGAAFVVRRGDAILLRTRPPKGLLGGMAEVPTSEWSSEVDGDQALSQAPDISGNLRWKRMPGTVSHVFTHFRLELSVYVAEVVDGTAAPEGMRFTRGKDLDGEALPTVMRKVLAHSRESSKATAAPKLAA